MARIKLSNGFSITPEGKYEFCIMETNYDEVFQKLTLKMQTEGGVTHTERLNFIKKDNTPNEFALGQFSRIAKACLPEEYDLDDVDPSDLNNLWFRCEISHEVVPSTTDSSKTFTFVRMEEIARY